MATATPITATATRATLATSLPKRVLAPLVVRKRLQLCPRTLWTPSQSKTGSKAKSSKETKSDSIDKTKGK
ncbi:hypothetical protein PPTG_03221 [Phytophthora nicotianae INRA-310]|uniref:Uncharacterized protein n=1 Tax=Phytophthora nicotianae (strain INRA-310) TaxID=761204 RepID=W2R443_PHYN3|nr:hypothetical protein PPTG_03221 [Phytophthora nicotianae INRA-310]ETN20153.1 hypothetical protein PPTG_03221 [Phytophthora nicotianae INRA-310]